MFIFSKRSQSDKSPPSGNRERLYHAGIFNFADPRAGMPKMMNTAMLPENPANSGYN
jgi:hypothetical protein